MRTLHQLGVVRRRRKAGTFFTRPDPSHLAAHVSFHVDLGTYTAEEIRRARAMLEQGIAAEAARNRTTRNLLEMTVALEAIEAAERDFDTVNSADRDFHEAVLAAAKNPLASVFSKVIAEGFERLPVILHVSEGEPFKRMLSEHKEIFESISKQKPEQAGELMYQHIAYPKTAAGKGGGSDQPIRRKKTGNG
jgi:DNA-binding FadR family transcriptional regulator